MPKYHCLYCCLITAIEDYYDARGDLHGDTVVIDGSEVIAAVAHLAAQVIAAEPDAESRTRLYEQIGVLVQAHVIDVIKKGTQPELLLPC